MTQHVSIDHQTATTAALFADSDLLDEIRSVLKRPDLGDDVLLSALASSPAARHGINHVTAMPQDRETFIRTLPVPAPRHGLEMPQHDLNPPLAVRFAPLVALWHRALQPLAPQLKRVPVPAKDR
ncbi:hypothetical protein [Roseibium aggregatum]|jgi:hypothetical protein|uniref:Glucosyltransferase MdoH n=1 Tax=Roseibium aggregatum (strain ATCC 25650 / DSM 13394 / JCM 20685 / NBRC 16684 / NCIMB 2208 / IAM 12614 / B1) TaxID=384765 RepID=A0NPW8_ROSAI|nr:hypothetical protein [Roseibium aggregatum]EAV45481.1 glucosyltransferase MdoH [Roseibium aggregatum IAM 12614]